MTALTEEQLLFTQLNQQTAKIAWEELQKHYAGGNMIEIDPSLDLVQTGIDIVHDKKNIIEPLIAEGKIKPVEDTQAQRWLEDEQALWALVIKPWILVQR